MVTGKRSLLEQRVGGKLALRGKHHGFERGTANRFAQQMQVHVGGLIRPLPVVIVLGSELKADHLLVVHIDREPGVAVPDVVVMPAMVEFISPDAPAPAHGVAGGPRAHAHAGGDALGAASHRPPAGGLRGRAPLPGRGDAPEVARPTAAHGGGPHPAASQLRTGSASVLSSSRR